MKVNSQYASEVLFHGIGLMFSKLKIKRNDWLLADTCSHTCSQAANHCALCVRKQPIIALYFEFAMNSSFKTSRPGRPTLNVILRWDSCPVESLLVCRRPRVISAVKLLYFISSSREFVQSYQKDISTILRH